MIGVTGSTGKTSTKDLLLALLAPHRRTVASRANFNTEIGLPLEILAAPAGTEVLVLEMAMRGAGQIAELAAIAEPDVGVIVSIGPVHLELLGHDRGDRRRQGRADRGARAGRDGGRARRRAAARAAPARRRARRSRSARAATCGSSALGRATASRSTCAGERIELEVPFTQAHLRRNLLAAVAAAQAVGVTPRRARSSSS